MDTLLIRYKFYQNPNLNDFFSSIFTFINYYPELVHDPIVEKLFESTSYHQEINKICSAGYKLDKTEEMVFHPLQINIVMMPPGQDLPLHQVKNYKSQPWPYYRLIILKYIFFTLG